MEGPDRPIFVLGCPRSGTTLFRTMLNAHPRIAVAPETRYLMWLYLYRYRWGDLRVRSNREQLAREIVGNERNTRFAVLELDPDEIIREIVEGPPTIGSAFGIVLRAYARKFGKPRWGDKRPAYYAFIEELDHMFPDAQFVHVVRDPRACVESLMRQEWYPDKAGPCAAAWIHAVREGHRSGRKLGPSRYLEVRYEDLVTDPEGSSRQVCAFLDEPFAEEMCRPELVVERVVPAGFEQHHQIRGGVNTASLHSWEKRLSADEVALVERASRKQMAQFGYQPSSPGGRVSPIAVADVVLRHTAWRRRLIGRRFAEARRLAYDDVGVAARLTAAEIQLATRPPEVGVGVRLLRSVRPLVGPPTRGLRRFYRRYLRRYRVRPVDNARVNRTAASE